MIGSIPIAPRVFRRLSICSPSLTDHAADSDEIYLRNAADLPVPRCAAIKKAWDSRDLDQIHKLPKRLQPIARRRILDSANTRFLVLTAAAKMPMSCWGRYGRVAVVEALDGYSPATISEHAPGCVRIVELWDRLNIGTTARCAFEIALKEAEELAETLNRP